MGTRMNYEVSGGQAIVEQYGASIQLDAIGDVIEVSGFPPAGRLPLKARLVPLSRAYALAKTRGFDLSKTVAELSYDEEIESITYRLRHRFRANAWGGRERIVEVDAHSGRLLRASVEHWHDHY